MATGEVARGPRPGPGPSMVAPWTVISAKSEGITPGFVVRDGTGAVYFVKFDPEDHPEMATSAEVIATGLFYAIGYNVPQNYIAFIDPVFLEVSPETKIMDNKGNSRIMSREDLRSILRKAPVGQDGRIRIVASREISGKPLGHFRYYGTRPDDGNDIFPHQDRRELRGLRIFSAWLNHDDARAINTLDVFASRGEKGYVKHYLIDFGSCLGSGSVMPQTRRGGNEYMWDSASALRTIATLGLWVRSYLKVEYPDHSLIGRFEAASFNPEKWVPEYPNPAFDRMDPGDAFWAARIVMAFTDEDVRTLVKEGMLSDRGDEEYLIQTLCERRDRIGRYYFGRVNPVGDFVMDGDALRFTDLAAEYGFSTEADGWITQWWTYDNMERKPAESVAGQSAISGNVVRIPPTLLDTRSRSYSFLEIQSLDPVAVGRRHPTRVFFRRGDSGFEIVGISRQ